MVPRRRRVRQKRSWGLKELVLTLLLIAWVTLVGMSFESSFLDWVDDQNAFFRALSMMPFYLTTFVGAVVVIVLVILITQDMGSWLFAAIIMYFLVTSYEWAQVLCCLIALVLAALIIWVEDW